MDNIETGKEYLYQQVNITVNKTEFELLDKNILELNQMCQNFKRKDFDNGLTVVGLYKLQ